MLTDSPSSSSALREKASAQASRDLFHVRSERN
jgi:hypothetical protein